MGSVVGVLLVVLVVVALIALALVLIQRQRRSGGVIAGSRGRGKSGGAS